MKKILTFIFIFGLVLILASCGSKAGAGEKGEKGADGNGIVSIEKTATTGNVDTYTITFTNGTSTTFTITNGTQGAQGPQGE